MHVLCNVMQRVTLVVFVMQHCDTGCVGGGGWGGWGAQMQAHVVDWNARQGGGCGAPAQAPVGGAGTHCAAESRTGWGRAFQKPCRHGRGS